MSDPTDLIRAVDLVHVVGYGHPPNGGPAEKFCKHCQSAWPCEVRRLRDALVGDREQLRLALIDQANTEAALAEANATIERVIEQRQNAIDERDSLRAMIVRLQRLADDYRGGPYPEFARAIRRAIEGPKS
ncbi:hypothetical protein [Tsukamurella sp. NPDC003166]|uniref:hypothetical protein n=1 Tax=Tsukamurella sp. NPDC003166 TaxID=3154444 RepID=UPI0033A10AA2